MSTPSATLSKISTSSTEPAGRSLAAGPLEDHAAHPAGRGGHRPNVGERGGALPLSPFDRPGSRPGGRVRGARFRRHRLERAPLARALSGPGRIARRTVRRSAGENHGLLRRARRIDAPDRPGAGNPGNRADCGGHHSAGRGCGPGVQTARRERAWRWHFSAMARSKKAVCTKL